MLTATSPCESEIDDCGVPLALPVPRCVPLAHRRVPLALPVPRRVPLALPVRRQMPLIPHALENGIEFVPAEGNRSAAYRTAKRAFDLVGAAALLVLLGPLMLAVLLLLAVTTRGKPLYFHRRVGYRGRTFRMIKFRTMRPDAEKMQHQVENEQEGPIFKNRRDPRVTRVGRLLRKTSLDETPQLFHVLSGQMSLVGPRPLYVAEVAQFAPGIAAAWPSCRA